MPFFNSCSPDAQDGAIGNAAAGTGLLDYRRYLSALKQSGFDGPLILHGLQETKAAHSVAFVRQHLESVA